MIFCANCGGKVHLTGRCRYCAKVARQRDASGQRVAEALREVECAVARLGLSWGDIAEEILRHREASAYKLTHEVVIP